MRKESLQPNLKMYQFIEETFNALPKHMYWHFDLFSNWLLGMQNACSTVLGNHWKECAIDIPAALLK